MCPRASVASDRRRRCSATFAIVIGVFGVLDGGAPFVLGIPMLVLGAALLVVSLRAAKSSAIRSRVPPRRLAHPGMGDGRGRQLPRWPRSWSPGTSASTGCTRGYSPLEFADAPAPPVLGILAAALPAFATPPLPVELA